MGQTLATSNTGTAQELLNFPITAGRTYFLVVESHAGGVGGPYALDIDVPPPQAPDGRADSATTALDDAAITINVLANDRDADGDLLAATLTIITPGRGSVEFVMIGGAPMLRYTPSGFCGNRSLHLRDYRSTRLDEQ